MTDPTDKPDGYVVAALVAVVVMCLWKWLVGGG